jgi:RNA polymerase sigma-70 factor (ECF subfamily)
MVGPDDPPGSATVVGRTDGTLWRDAANGDESAFAELFERHAEAVWNHAYRLTGSWARAEDLASATFLTAWRKRTEVTLIRESALPWLYTVTANLARGEHRKSVRFLRAIRRLDAPELVDDHADAVADRIDGDRRLRAVLDEIARLPKAEREAVELCLLGEVSTADAAELLGVTEATVRSRISRARAHLRSRTRTLP